MNDGRVALVTTSTGLGRAVARTLARNGYQVFVVIATLA